MKNEASALKIKRQLRLSCTLGLYCNLYLIKQLDDVHIDIGIWLLCYLSMSVFLSNSVILTPVNYYAFFVKHCDHVVVWLRREMEDGGEKREERPEGAIRKRLPSKKIT